MDKHLFVQDANVLWGAINHCGTCGLLPSNDIHDVITVPEDNQPYLTILKGIAGDHVVTLLEFSPSDGSYKIIKSKRYNHKGDAFLECCDWAKRDGLEIR